jgi:hypothetical protein
MTLSSKINRTVRLLVMPSLFFSVVGCGAGSSDNGSVGLIDTVTLEVRAIDTNPDGPGEFSIKTVPFIPISVLILGDNLNFGPVPIGTEVIVSLKNASGGAGVRVDILTNGCIRNSNSCFIAGCTATTSYVLKSESCPSP